MPCPITKKKQVCVFVPQKLPLSLFRAKGANLPFAPGGRKRGIAEREPASNRKGGFNESNDYDWGSQL